MKKRAREQASVQRDMLRLRETWGDMLCLYAPNSPTRRSGVPLLFGPRRAQRLAQTREQARQELALRAEALTQQLASCGLTSHRLNNADLARLYYQCLTPDRANAHPLSDRVLSSVGRPSRVKRRSPSLPHDQVVRPGDSRNHGAAAGSIPAVPSAALAAAAPAQTPSAVPPTQR